MSDAIDTVRIAEDLRNHADGFDSEYGTRALVDSLREAADRLAALAVVEADHQRLREALEQVCVFTSSPAGDVLGALVGCSKAARAALYPAALGREGEARPQDLEASAKSADAPDGETAACFRHGPYDSALDFCPHPDHTGAEATRCPVDGRSVCPSNFPACKCATEGCYPGVFCEESADCAAVDHFDDCIAGAGREGEAAEEQAP